MASARFTQRCWEEDLQRLPRWVQKAAIALARQIPHNPGFGDRLAPPLDEFFRVRIRGYRMVYTYQFETDTWWILLIDERRPGKRRDVYAVLERLVKEGLALK